MTYQSGRSRGRWYDAADWVDLSEDRLIRAEFGEDVAAAREYVMKIGPHHCRGAYDDSIAEDW